MSQVTLSGKTAIVTGASSGIGRSIAETLGAAGAHVILAGRTRDAMDESKKKIEAAGGKADIVVCDVRKVDDTRKLVADAVAKTGRLDIMVNNAGLSYPAPILDGDPEHWRAMLETNILALLVGCQEAVRAMRKCGAEGHVVNISSIAAHRSDSGVYGSTKHAVSSISSTLRRELEDDNIRVVNICPGAIGTNFARNFDPGFISGFLKTAGADVDVRQGERLPDEVMETVQPRMRQLLSSPQDVANAVLFAVTQPIWVNIAELTIRPPKQIPL
jgi:NADP-dependent 3-hydroxy acid dehydrogenase YdfG